MRGEGEFVKYHYEDVEALMAVVVVVITMMMLLVMMMMMMMLVVMIMVIVMMTTTTTMQKMKMTMTNDCDRNIGRKKILTWKRKII